MKALENRLGRATVLAAVGSFLALDLMMFGNCIIPTQDANPKPVQEGGWQAGATGTAAIIMPIHGGLDLRRGLADGDVGAHAFFEFLPGDGSVPGSFSWKCPWASSSRPSGSGWASNWASTPA